MAKPNKPREEPKLDIEDLEKEANNIYKKQWPRDKENLAEEDLAEDSQETDIAGILDHPSYIKLQQELTDMEEKANKYQNQQLRAQAELDNIRRRAELDVVKAHKYALGEFVNELLPVVDSLERALLSEVHGNEYAKKIHEGIELTMSLLLKTLKNLK